MELLNQDRRRDLSALIKKLGWKLPYVEAHYQDANASVSLSSQGDVSSDGKGSEERR